MEGLTACTSDGYDDNITANTYDGQGRVKTVTRQKRDGDYDANVVPNGDARTTLYVAYTYEDSRGLLLNTVNQTDVSGVQFNQTATTYDSLGRAVAQSVSDGTHSLTTAYDYDAQGRVWQVTDSSGNTTITQYDAAGRTIRQTDGDGNIVETSYDAAGRVTKTIRKDHKPGGHARRRLSLVRYQFRLRYRRPHDERYRPGRGHRIATARATRPARWSRRRRTPKRRSRAT